MGEDHMKALEGFQESIEAFEGLVRSLVRQGYPEALSREFILAGLLHAQYDNLIQQRKELKRLTE